MTLFLGPWVWTNLDKEIDPYTNILGTKEEIVYALKFLLEVRTGTNWVFIWIVILEVIFEGYLFYEF
jgi:hypothetical protein